MKEKVKKAGEWLIDKILDNVGRFLYILYEVITDTIQSIIDFFVAAFFLYISWGVILLVICIILYLITKALGAH